jgi:hypothetical protein
MLYYNLVISVRLGLLCVTGLLPLPPRQLPGRVLRSLRDVVRIALYCKGFRPRKVPFDPDPSIVGASTK